MSNMLTIPHPGGPASCLKVKNLSQLPDQREAPKGNIKNLGPLKTSPSLTNRKADEIVCTQTLSVDPLGRGKNLRVANWGFGGVAPKEKAGACNGPGFPVGSTYRVGLVAKP